LTKDKLLNSSDQLQRPLSHIHTGELTVETEIHLYIIYPI